MKFSSSSSTQVPAEMPLSSRVLAGLELSEESRFQHKETWGHGLTILDDESRKLPLVKRKALAIAKVLSGMPVAIKKHELIVGMAIQANTAQKAPFPEYATPEENESAQNELSSTQSVWGHFSPYYPDYLKLGINGLQNKVRGLLAQHRKEGTDDKASWYESVIISLDGVKALISRYRDLAAGLATGEDDTERQQELNEIADTCSYLLENPPQSFRQAMQSVWFAHISFFSTMNHLPLGRFDQYLSPYLEHDLEQSVITLDAAQELVDLFWLKCNDLLQSFAVDENDSPAATNNMTSKSRVIRAGSLGVFLGGRTSFDLVQSDGASNQQFLQTLTLGGVTPEGDDGTNLLTLLCLNATLRLGVPQPCIYVRFHDSSPSELYKKAADCIRAGCVGPTIYNDMVIIPSIVQTGIPIEHARDYTSDGCWEPHVQGRTLFKHGYISVAEAFDRVISPSRWRDMVTPVYIREYDPFKNSIELDPYNFQFFDEVMAAVKEKLDEYIAGFINIREQFEDGRLYRIAPLPLLSAFVRSTLASGKDITQGGTDYIVHLPEMSGLSHVADSLAVIKKLCFSNEKTINWHELLDAVHANWEDKEYLRQLVKTRVPAYGNDDDYVDEIARELVSYYVKSINKHSAQAKSKIKYVPGLATYEHYTTLGRYIGATPDGRMAGEPLSTNASPSIGRALSGATAALNSYLKLPLADLPGGSILDLSINSQAKLLGHLESFLKSFLAQGGNILSVAVNDSAKLRAAQQEPEKYRDLKVRVGGYEAYFVDLPPRHQELQIQRYEQYA